MTSSRPALARVRLLSVPVGAVLLLGACGGGGGGGPERPGTAECRAYAANVGIAYEEALEFGLCQAFFDGTAVTPEPVSERTAEPEPEAVVIPPLSAFPPAAPLDGTTRDAAGSRFYAGAANSAILEGVALGDGSVANDVLARSVPFIVTRGHEDLVTRDVRIVRRSTTSSQRVVVFVVENVGDRRLCSVTVFGATPLGSDSTRIGSSGGLTTVSGSVALTPLGDDIESCIEPKSTAYATMGVFGVDEEEIVAVHVESVAQLVPFSAEETFDGVPEVLAHHFFRDGTLSLDIVNNGTTGFEIDDIELFLLDENGRVVGVSDISGDEELGRGEVLALDHRPFGPEGFEGTAASVRAVVEFSIPYR